MRGLNNVHVDYDDLNRPIQKTYSGPGACDTTPDVTYGYDATLDGNEGIGLRTGMGDGSGSTTWFYNAMGQATSETHTIDGANYALSSQFDAFGRPLTQSLPSAETLNYSYNAGGKVTDQQLGKGLFQQSCYNMTPSDARLDLSYAYQANGTVGVDGRIDITARPFTWVESTKWTRIPVGA